MPDTDLPLVLLSNRGPVSHYRDGSGELKTNRGSGGLVSALSGLAERLSENGVVWVCGALTDADVTAAARHKDGLIPIQPRVVDGKPEGPKIDMRMVDTDKEAYHKFYEVWSNPILWFIQHELYKSGDWQLEITQETRDAFERGYAEVNRVYADAVIDEVRKRDSKALVMLHDYHFYLVAERVREQCPDTMITHFIHIPWPSPEAWHILPEDIRERLFRGLLGNDIVGFQTRSAARNFALCAQELPGVRVERDPDNPDTLEVHVDGRTVRVRHYPISVNPEALKEIQRTQEVQKHISELEKKFQTEDLQLILRVDRTDPSKNAVRGFDAFGKLLDNHPELVGKVRFLALLQKSRTNVPAYADYIKKIDDKVAEINARYAPDGWQPIDLHYVEDLPLAVAAYSICDVIMVNPVADGMNLVAKEVAVLAKEVAARKQRCGVLALSEKAGVYEELSEYAVTLDPFSIDQMAGALYTALNLEEEDRRERLKNAAKQVETHHVEDWLNAQLKDIPPLRQLSGSPKAYPAPHQAAYPAPIRPSSGRACPAPGAASSGSGLHRVDRHEPAASEPARQPPGR
ncbi:trehalose-6-phosphate synthase [Frankia sp. B2]|uniref:alpha,alpha-trehalose-phosphate synthase (UDP-forming) n=1 Tax=unclassified Frankia TaxID=2632575 RepID=UPI0004611619|nr:MULTISPECIES: trehalose-6-phosphate synthase [unclassified Frankia]KDA40865.1 trehalose 6-phosphate synthase [Frankia sp. BMG5.23]TFE31141.1 trehalose-6-phosphate synthase [Frankia sp. B2]